MAKKKPEAPVEPTPQQIEDALRDLHAAPPVEGHPVYAAFNPAEFARKAAAIAKIAAPFVAIAAGTNWSSPVAAAKAIVQLYSLVQGQGAEPAPDA